VSYTHSCLTPVIERLAVTSLEGETFELELIACPPVPNVTADENVGFGKVVADGRVNTRTVTLVNKGALGTTFRLVCPKTHGTLVIKPEHGVLGPATSNNAAVTLTVEYSAVAPGVLDVQVPVLLEAQHNAPILHITADAVEHSLKVCVMLEHVFFI
jgi:hypothetical protein